MNISEPDTVFFGDCLKYALGTDPEKNDEDNVKCLANMKENRSLLENYIRWFTFYEEMAIECNASNPIKLRIAQIRLSLQDALSNNTSHRNSD